MTWGELYHYAEEKLIAGLNDISDWRPAGWLYINDLVISDGGEAYVPYGIRFWLENGDSVIYVKDMNNETEKKIRKPDSASIEIEGGGNYWWYVCSECHTAIDRNDRFCRQCGKRFE